jgi:hypothetical protein
LGILSFFSCSQEKKETELVLCATTYKIELPTFSHAIDEKTTIERINVIYIIKSERLLNSNDIFVEKTNNLYDSLKTIICIDTINQSEYFYECYSNKYIDVVYTPQNFKNYYHKIKNSIKNTDVFFDNNILQKADNYKEYFVTEMDTKLPNRIQVYDVNNW